MTSVNGWDCREDGNIAVGPLLGYQTAVIPMTGLLRLETAQSEDQLQSGLVGSVQLAMTAPQLRELAQALLRMA